MTIARRKCNFPVGQDKKKTYDTKWQFSKRLIVKCWNLQVDVFKLLAELVHRNDVELR
jgi:hypothetical protein